jgi:uncharacterized protein (DUF302 family)
MHASVALQTYVVHERFEKALKLLHNALAEREIEVVREFNVADALSLETASTQGSARILLVDCPILDFEAMALDRASAVFFPLHILVSASGGQTRISMANFSGLLNARLPIGAADPIDRLRARVELALESVLQRSGGAVN